MMEVIELFEFITKLLKPKPLPKPPNEISWDEYLAKLEVDDQKNIETIIRRVQNLADRYGISFAIMAVGSVLNGREPDKEGAYGDVDLLILPHIYPNDERIEKLLGTFVFSQCEVTAESWPHGQSWSNWNCYDVCRFADLSFPKGRHIQLFFYEEGQFHRDRKTLRQKLEMEAEAVTSPRKFAYIICSPSPA